MVITFAKFTRSIMREYDDSGTRVLNGYWKEGVQKWALSFISESIEEISDKRS